MKKLYFKLRRSILRFIIPEFIWPNTVVLNGIEVEVRNKPYSFGTKYSLCNNTYEFNERKLLLHRIIEGDIIYEFGGSVGILTSLMSRFIGNIGFVVSVEASEKLSTIAKTNFRDFKNIIVINGFGFPVFSLEKSVKINGLNEDNGSLGGIVDFTLSDIKDQQINDKVYDINTINELTKLEPTVLVIDIEGSELIFENQFPAFPLSVRLILIEFHPDIYGVAVIDKLIKIILSESFILLENSNSVYLFARDN